MEEKDIQKMIADNYEESKEDTLRGMIRDFYNRKNTSSIILVWVYFIMWSAIAYYCACAFFDTEDTQKQIMYSAIFIICVQMCGLVKILGWIMIYRNSLKREIKRLEIRIAELNQTVKER